MELERIVSILVQLLEDQENTKISYTITPVEKEVQKENTA